MSNTPSDLKYSSTHEWAKLEEDGRITVGITDHAQSLLGDIVFVELPEIDTEIGVSDEVGVIESVKAASDLYTPITGRIVEVNAALSDKPELINSDPYGAGWIFRVEPDDTEELRDLLESDEYLDEIND